MWIVNSYSFDVDGTLRVAGHEATSLSGEQAEQLRLAAVAGIAQARQFGRDEGALQYRTKLRDEFAMAALAAISFDGLPDGGGCTIESYDAEGVARQVYKIADAMLAERAKKGGA